MSKRRTSADIVNCLTALGMKVYSDNTQSSLPAVYFLFRHDELRYIGCALEIEKRVRHHHVKFDSYLYVEFRRGVPYSNLGRAPWVCEEFLIGVLNPPENKQNVNRDGRGRTYRGQSRTDCIKMPRGNKL